ncbi:helix-turn-helix domain-containing protein [Peribacillus faecalis]|nr:helix-turn-helix domain-containing protein [Peribacillus faecalis]
MKPFQGDVKFEDQLIELTVSEYKLLVQLMFHPDRVLLISN